MEKLASDQCDQIVRLLIFGRLLKQYFFCIGKSSLKLFYFLGQILNWTQTSFLCCILEPQH